MKSSYQVILLEDDVAVVRVVKGVLAPLSCDVSVLDSPAALTDADLETADLILLSSSLRGADVFSWLRSRPQSPALARIPTLLLAASESERERASATGCADIAVKPLNAEELTIKVETILNLGAHRSELKELATSSNVLDAMADGIIILDEGLRVARINETARNLLFPGEEGRGQDLLMRLEALFDVDYVGDFERDALAGPLCFDVVREETPTVRPLVLEVRTSIVRDSFRAITGVVVILADVTEKRRRAFQEEMFLNFISHKLRTPMALVHKNASMLHKKVLGPLNADQERFTATLYEKCCELVDSFEKLLGFTMLKSKQLDLPPERILVREYLLQRLEWIQRLPQPKKLEWEISCEDGSTAVHMNRKYLDMLINNLVENAIKFCDKETVKVRVSAEPSGEMVNLSIADNGPGIPPEEWEKVFEEFYQVDKDRTLNVAGTGLGLAIARRIVTSCGGDILVKSEMGKGSTFYFTLPAYAAAVPSETF